jgi:hypothetical protein
VPLNSHENSHTITYLVIAPTTRISALGAERKCRMARFPAAIRVIAETMCSLRAFLRLTDTVEKLNLLPRSQFLRQQVGFKKKALGFDRKADF